jgi:hypothetical protein
MMRWLDATGERGDLEPREVYLRFGADPALRLPGAYLTEGDADLVSTRHTSTPGGVSSSGGGAAT